MTFALGSAQSEGSTSLSLLYWEIPAFVLYIITLFHLSQCSLEIWSPLQENGNLPSTVLCFWLMREKDRFGELGYGKLMLPALAAGCAPDGAPPPCSRQRWAKTSTAGDRVPSSPSTTCFDSGSKVELICRPEREPSSPRNLGFVSLWTPDY